MLPLPFTFSMYNKVAKTRNQGTTYTVAARTDGTYVYIYGCSSPNPTGCIFVIQRAARRGSTARALSLSLSLLDGLTSGPRASSPFLLGPACTTSCHFRLLTVAIGSVEKNTHTKSTSAGKKGNKQRDPPTPKTKAKGFLSQA